MTSLIEIPFSFLIVPFIGKVKGWTLLLVLLSCPPAVNRAHIVGALVDI